MKTTKELAEIAINQEKWEANPWVWVVDFKINK